MPIGPAQGVGLVNVAQRRMGEGLNILLAIESGGGSGQHFADLAAQLVKLGHQVSAIYSPTRLEARYVAKLEAAGLVALELFPMRRDVSHRDVPAWLRLRRLIQRLGPFDIIHAHSSKAGALARLAAPQGATVVYTPHAFRTMDPNLSGVGRVLYGGVELALARLRTDSIIAVSPEEVTHAVRLGIPAEKVRLVLNGIAPPPVVDRRAVRAGLGLEGDDIAVGFVGRLCAQKDPVRFAEAIAIAAKHNLKVKGFIFGDGELREEVARHESENLRIVSGKVAQEFLPALDIFALTSRYEGMPYVLVEALYAGLPILTTEVGGARATVSNDVNGMVMPVGISAADFADRITMLSEDAVRISAYRAASASRALDFTLEKMAAQTVAIYKSAIRAERQ